MRVTVVLLLLLAGACNTLRTASRLATAPTSVEEMLFEISAAKLHGYVDTLVSFGTRHTLSDAKHPTRGIGAARRWIFSEFESMAKASGRTGDQAMQVSFDAHVVEPDGRRITRQVEVVNVVAVLPGSMPQAAGRRYLVLGHYDSRVTDANNSADDAPGANDDASGVALLMEMARVMSTRRYDATLVFVATAGEEQGLIGARRLAAALKEKGVDVRGVLSNDIVGDPGDRRDDAKRVRVFSQSLPKELSAEALRRTRLLSKTSDSPSRQLARYVARVAGQHETNVRPMMVFRSDRFLRGGDHLAFNEMGAPAVRFTVVTENYDRQHQDVRKEGNKQYGDLLEYIDADYLAGVTRVNAATLAHLANAPSVPGHARIVLSGLQTDITIKWEPAPEPDVAGYEVLWRETSSPIWQHTKDVGNATQASLPLSKDNWFFGVRAYDKEGFRSPVTFLDVARE